MPQQREVVCGSWHQPNGVARAVYAKVFKGKRAYHHFKRDLAGVRSLLKAGIPTPAILAEDQIDGKKTEYVAIYSAIQNAKNIEEVWLYLADDARFNLAKRLVQVLAQHHAAGLIQTDLYLKNFLLADDAIYSLDGDGVRHLSKLFRWRQQLKNLATLFSKMDVLDGKWLHELFSVYCQRLGFESSMTEVIRLQRLTSKIRHQVTTRYADKKVFRRCTDVSVVQDATYFLAFSTDFNVERSGLLSLDRFLLNTAFNIKNGRTCTIASAQIAGRLLVIKRYNIKNFWHGLNRAFRQSRAAISWANAHRLIISNIATPKPLALVEERFGFLRGRAYYLSEYVDAPDVLQFFASTQSDDERRLVASNIAKLFHKLYLLKFSHGDFKATNVKVLNFEPVLIDLDALQAHFGQFFSDWRFERKHVMDIKRLMQNWRDDADAFMLLKNAFLTEYAGQSPLVHILNRAGLH
ncbi:MAG: hypothetical protein FJY53_04195 [Betaproteobacteria bacterium]|nr:hypothetical protein [Betaproteobacteria bacterium]